MNLKELDQEYDNLLRTYRSLKAAEDRYDQEAKNGAHGEEVGGPYSAYGLERELSDLKERFVRFSVRQIRKRLCPNVWIDPEKVASCMSEALGEQAFDSGWIYEHVEREYASHQRELALSQIRQVLRRFLPVVKADSPDRGRRLAQTSEEMLRGRSIVLRVHLYDPRIDLVHRINLPELLDALGKAARVAIEGTPPERASGETLPREVIYGASEDFFKMHRLKGPILGIQFLKKGGIIARFNDRTEARKVARLILEEPPPA